MRKAIPVLVALGVLALGVAGCEDNTSPRDVTPPAAPRGLYSVTGDGQATLHWLANTESDVQGYRVYDSPCASGPNCPFDRIGATTTTQFVATGLTNGTTRFFAVAAVDRSGNESALTVEDVFDTPRPAGSATLGNFVQSPAGAGWDFSAFSSKSAADTTSDIFFGYNGAVYQMFATGHSGIPNVEIQDAGYASTLDAVDFAPNGGWSPTGTAELIPGHCYVVWTSDDHYAKFRVTGLSPSVVSFDWAYQTDRSNPELRSRPVRPAGTGPRPIAWQRK